MSPTIALTVILLAAAGQIFLAQSQAAWTLWPGLLLMTGALWQFRRVSDPSPASVSLKWEWALFFIVILLAAFFLLWRLKEFPAGLHMDQGQIGWCALRVLHEGWRPLEEALQYQNPFPLEFYQLALWFSIAGSSLYTYHLFFILLALA